MNNTSIGILGPRSQLEEGSAVGSSFRILENGAVEPFLKTMIPKAGTTVSTIIVQSEGDDADVQMSG